jgi:hypothetical protein
MSEIATITVFLLAIAALIASFTAVERRVISAIQAAKILLAETVALKKILSLLYRRFHIGSLALHRGSFAFAAVVY